MDGEWRTINGVHVLIGKDGAILKGPKSLQKSDIQKRLKKQLTSNNDDEEIKEIKDDIKSFKAGKSDVFEDMNREQFKKILNYLGIKTPNVLSKIERIGYDGTFTTIGRVSIRELKTFGEVLRKIIES